MSDGRCNFPESMLDTLPHFREPLSPEPPPLDPDKLVGPFLSSPRCWPPGTPPDGIDLDGPRVRVAVSMISDMHGLLGVTCVLPPGVPHGSWIELHAWEAQLPLLDAVKVSKATWDAYANAVRKWRRLAINFVNEGVMTASLDPSTGRAFAIPSNGLDRFWHSPEAIMEEDLCRWQGKIREYRVLGPAPAVVTAKSQAVAIAQASDAPLAAALSELAAAQKVNSELLARLAGLDDKPATKEKRA